jgi:hypothetical protein
LARDPSPEPLNKAREDDKIRSQPLRRVLITRTSAASNGTSRCETPYLTASPTPGIVQIDEPYLQARPGRRTTAERHFTPVSATPTTPRATSPAGSDYPFFTELNEIPVDQLVIEAAQPKLDLALLREIEDKDVALGVLDVGDPQVERAEEVAERISGGARACQATAAQCLPDCGMKFLPRDVAFREAARFGRRRPDHPFRVVDALPGANFLLGGRGDPHSPARLSPGKA